MGRSKKQGADAEGTSTPSSELLAKAEEALRKLGEPTIEPLEDVPLPKEAALQRLRALVGASLDEFIARHYLSTKQLTPPLARRLADTPDLQVAVARVEKLREHVEKLREYVERLQRYASAVAKQVAATALLPDERSSRHHVAELLDDPLSQEALNDLCWEPPASPLEPPKPMTARAAAYHVYRRAMLAFEEMLPLVKGKEPEEALGIVAERDPEVAEWIKDYVPAATRANFLLLLTQQAKPKRRGKPYSLHRFLALKLGGSVVGMDWSTFERWVVNE